MDSRSVFPFVSILLLLVCPFLSTCTGTENNSRREHAPGLTAWMHGYDTFFQRQMALTHTLGAAVVVVQNGQIVFEKGYGYAGPDTSRAVTPHTVFRIGSVSKGFAGILTGMLVESGLLRWTDCLKDHIGDFRLRDSLQAAAVTLRNLLSHTTGLPYHAFTDMIERGYSLDELAENYLPTARLGGKEGTFYAYQNVAYALIEKVIASGSGVAYETLLREKIFDPCGMQSSSCDLTSLLLRQDKALPGSYTGRGWRPGRLDESYYNYLAAGGINASAHDLGGWLKLLTGHRPDLIRPVTLDTVFMPVVKTDKERWLFRGWVPRHAASYAMGWRVLEVGGETIIYHGGYVNGYRAEIAFNRKNSTGIAVLFNESTPLCSKAVPAFFQMHAANFSKSNPPLQ
jgi:beta-lactamase class C